MTEYVINGNTVRIHGEPDMENFKKATEIFLKKVTERRKKNDQVKDRTAC